MLDLGISRYAGKGQGELSLLRALWDIFRPGDVLLTDRLMCSWAEILLLKQRGVDFLRCKTPTLVRKEIWTHILACNLIRTIMAQAATRHADEPKSGDGTEAPESQFVRLRGYPATAL